MKKEGKLPPIFVRAKTLPEAWEKAVVKVWERGVNVRTHYDKKNPDGSFIDPPSREGTVMIYVENPFNEPRIAKNFPGGPNELEAYTREVVDGIHNHWIDPGTTKWTYTYHERMTGYQPSENLNDRNARGILVSRRKLYNALTAGRTIVDLLHDVHNLGDGEITKSKILELAAKGVNPAQILEQLISGKLNVNPVDQVELLIQDLKRDITSKGAQATTWMPTADPGLESNRPCLQRFWFRPLAAEIDGQHGYMLNLNTHWRSRDLYKAWFMNVFAITEWQKNVAERLEREIGMPVRVGGYIDISDSLHLYGAYVDPNTEEGKKFEKEVMKMKQTSCKERAFNSEAFESMMAEERARLKEDPDYMNAEAQAKKRR